MGLTRKPFSPRKRESGRGVEVMRGMMGEVRSMGWRYGVASEVRAAVVAAGDGAVVRARVEGRETGEEVGERKVERSWSRSVDR